MKKMKMTSRTDEIITSQSSSLRSNQFFTSICFIYHLSIVYSFPMSTLFLCVPHSHLNATLPAPRTDSLFQYSSFSYIILFS